MDTICIATSSPEQYCLPLIAKVCAGDEVDI